MQTKISNILKKKGNVVYDIEVGKSVVDATKKMTEHGIGALLVREGDRMVGIVGLRDLAKNCLHVDVDIAKTPIESVMTSPLAFIKLDTSIATALKVMSEIDHRHLPVYDGDKLVGVVALHDLLQWLTEEYEAHVDYLESYIRGH